MLIPSLCVNNSRNLILKTAQTLSLWFFLCFPQINVGGDSAHFLSWRQTHWPFYFGLFTPSPKGRLRQLATSLGIVRELGHSISVQYFYHDFFIYFPFSRLSFVLSIFVYNLWYVVVFGVCLSIDYIHS